MLAYVFPLICCGFNFIYYLNSFIVHFTYKEFIEIFIGQMIRGQILFVDVIACHVATDMFVH